METFFIYSPKGHIIAKEWYDLINKIAENEGKTKFISRVENEFPGIADKMPKEYLWVYIAGKYLLITKPYLIDKLNTESAEEGPWYESELKGWDNLNLVCKELSKQKPCPKCAITKLHNGLRKECDIEIIPTN
jgi:hypothetical protein